MSVRLLRDGKLLKPQVIRAEMGESSFETISEDRALKCAELIAGGITDEKTLMELCRLSHFKLHRLLRSGNFQKILRQERQARAELAMCDIVDLAIDDSKSKDPKIRQEARKFVKAVADGPTPGVVNQNNNINEAWDPSKDEQLFNRAREMFTDTSKKVVADIVNTMIEDDEDQT